MTWAPIHAGAVLAGLVGMLTLGGAWPKLMRGSTLGLSWEWPLMAASCLAVAGGLLVYVLGEGPHLPKSSGRLPLSQGLAALRSPRFRSVAGGYFGHLWVLYAFWTLTPLLIGRELQRLGQSDSLIPWLSFAVIGIGAAGCVGGGRLSRTLGSEWVARRALMISGAFCLVYPWLNGLSPVVLMVLLIVWGIAVVADSPQFSALASAAAPRATVSHSMGGREAGGTGVSRSVIGNDRGQWDGVRVYRVLATYHELTLA